jgi:hypothetical protein
MRTFIGGSVSAIITIGLLIGIAKISDSMEWPYLNSWSLAHGFVFIFPVCFGGVWWLFNQLTRRASSK